MSSKNAKINKLKKQLEEMQKKAPRHSAPPSKIIPDKTKYNRKKKHKGQDETN